MVSLSSDSDRHQSLIDRLSVNKETLETDLQAAENEKTRLNTQLECLKLELDHQKQLHIRQQEQGEDMTKHIATVSGSYSVRGGEGVCSV